MNFTSYARRKKKKMTCTKIFSKFAAVRLSVVGFVCLCTILWFNSGCNTLPLEIEERQNREAISRAAFLEAYKVFLHPRCMNCHPEGDSPLQTDDSVSHAMRVQRGPEGKGVYGMQCSTCHQLANWPGAHTPPGAPNWHLPPPEMPMVFQNRTPSELARQLKDPQQNGGKTLEEILHHVSHDALVLWGWDPGEGRSTPPLSHAEFVSEMETWINNGAAEPK